MGDVIDRSGKGFWRKDSVSVIEEMWRKDAEFYDDSKPADLTPGIAIEEYKTTTWIEEASPVSMTSLETLKSWTEPCESPVEEAKGWQNLGPKLLGDGDVTDVALLNGVMFVVQDGVISYLRDGKTWERLDT